MLVLTRKVNEKIIIGDDIEVTIIEVRPDRVRLGFTADKTVTIHREEIHRLIQNEESRRLNLPDNDAVIPAG